MRKIFISLLLILSCTYMLHAENREGAQWITSIEENVDNPNTWIAFRRVSASHLLSRSSGNCEDR